MNANGKRLKELRKERGEIQSVVAKKTGLSIKTIYRYERGKVKRCDLRTIEKLADYYSVDASYILEEDNENNL